MGRNRRANAKERPEEVPAPAQPFLDGLSPQDALTGAVTALFVVRPMYPSESVAVTGDGLPVVMLWLLVLAVWALLAVRGRIARVRFAWPGIALAAFVIWHSIAAVRAAVYESPRPALNMLWEWVGLAVAFFLPRQVFSTAVQRRAIGAVMIALAVVVSGYGLYQYFIELPATRASYEESPDEVLRAAGIWYPAGSPLREAFEQRVQSVEPIGTFALTNSLAGFLAPWAIVVLAVAILCAGDVNLGRKVGIATLLMPLGLCLLLTKSRSAYLAVACGSAGILGVWTFAGRSRAQIRRGIVIACVSIVLLAAGIAGAIAVGGLDKEVLSEAPKSLGYRVQYWQSTWQMIREMPLFGCGPGNYQACYTAFKLPVASEEIADPHNFAFEIWATAGTPALVAFLGVLLACFACIVRSARPSAPATMAVDSGKERPEGEHDARTVYVGAVAGMLLVIPMGLMSVAPPTWLIVPFGILLGGFVLVQLQPWVARGEDSPWLWLLAAIVVLIHLLFAGGIAYPGVATGMWLLLALALNCRECGTRPLLQRQGSIVFGLAACLAIACYFTGYRPTLTARTQEQRALEGVGDPALHLRRAAEADPWSAAPWEHLAELYYQRWLNRPDPNTLLDFEQAVRDALALAPRSAKLRHRFGLDYAEISTRTGDRGYLDQGIGLMEAAVSLYPNDAQLRADLAESYLLADERKAYVREATKALQLDALTPHLDKKLSDEQRERLLRTDPAPLLRAASPG